MPIEKNGEEISTIITDGKSEYVIAYGSEDDEILSFSARELQKYLEQMSKVRIPIKPAQSLREKNYLILLYKKNELNRISNDFNSQTAFLPEDSFVIKTINKSLVLGGTI